MIEDFEASEFILDKRKKETEPFYKRPLIILPIVAVVLILIVAIIIITVNVNDKNENQNGKQNEQLINYIYNQTKVYLLSLNKIAISDKRIQNIFIRKLNKTDFYEDLLTLELVSMSVSWNQIKQLEKNENLFSKLSQEVINLLQIPDKNDKNFIHNLFNVIMNNKTIENYKSDKNIIYINSQLKEGKLVDELNMVVLYSFINLPFQMGFFSTTTYKNDFLAEVLKAMQNYPQDEIFHNINQNMSLPPENSIYMVLGAGQEEERKRIEALEPNINIVNTGIRTQLLQSEIDNCLVDNIENYYINEDLRPLMEKCLIDGKMTDDEYENFKQDCTSLKNNITTENALNLFERYNFSVETANTVIEYLKKGYEKNDIVIIRLGGNSIENKDIKYSEKKAFILFDIIDVENSFYNGKNISFPIKRATSVANAKAIWYLMNECPEFISKEKEIVLVSGKYYAERQLEACNIVYHFSNINLMLHYVIWNKETDTYFNDVTMVKYMMEFEIKGFNIIATTTEQTIEQEYEKSKKESVHKIKNYISNLIKLTNDAKSGKY